MSLRLPAHSALRASCLRRAAHKTPPTRLTACHCRSDSSNNNKRSMSSSSSSVSVGKPTLGAVPANADPKSHHVKSASGETTHFQNPHASAKRAFESWTIPFRIIRGKIDGTMRAPPLPAEADLVPVRRPAFLPTRFPSSSSSSSPSRLRTTWLGHASHYVEFPSGLRVLLDPVLEDRCSPLTFAGPRRYTRRACAVADLPFLDAVVVSHSHYDHLSLPTVREIARRFPAAHFFVGAGLARWFRAAGVARVTEMDWWEDVDVEVAVPGPQDGGGGGGDGDGAASVIAATLSCLPAQHSSSRYGLDADTTLWCSWAIKSGTAAAANTKTLYFGGDTGYRAVPSDDDNKQQQQQHAHLPTNPDFAQIGALKGPFDLGLLPIGAYQPRALFSWMHADPDDAVDIFRDTRCRRALGIHWGTWMLTMEPVMEPPAKLRDALRRRGLAETGVFDVCDIGESREF